MTCKTEPTLAKIRAGALMTLSERCNVLRPARTRDATGAYKSTFATFASDVPCVFIAPSLTSDVQGAATPIPTTQYTFLFAYDMDIRTTDRILIQGRTFEIVALDIARQLAIFRKVLAKEIL